MKGGRENERGWTLVSLIQKAAVFRLHNIEAATFRGK